MAKNSELENLRLELENTEYELSDLQKEYEGYRRGVEDALTSLRIGR